MTTILTNARQDFPILQQTNRGKPLVYLDSASSAQKPQQVIDAVSAFYAQDYANIHRGIYELSERATDRYEDARTAVASFINAADRDEIVFVKSSTEGINLVADCLSRSYFKAGDEVLISAMEHHSNIVPWYQLQKECGIVLKVIPITDSGAIDIAAFHSLFSSRTKLLALSHASNVLGVINPVKEMIAFAHSKQVPVLLDARKRFLTCQLIYKTWIVIFMFSPVINYMAPQESVFVCQKSLARCNATLSRRRRHDRNGFARQYYFCQSTIQI